MREAIESSEVLTISDTAAVMRCSKAHVANLVNGKVRGAPQRGHGLAVSMEVYTKSDLQQKREAVRKLDSAVIRKQRQKKLA